MRRRLYLSICATLFAAVAVAHLTRIVGGWEIEIAGWVVPHWFSFPGLVVAGALSAWGFALASRDRHG
jgi:hypothetical protein